jgi:hypothetical protein
LGDSPQTVHAIERNRPIEAIFNPDGAGVHKKVE